MNFNSEFYTSNIFLFIILLFVIVYIIINWDKVSSGDFFNGQLVKPILITGILFLIIHLFMTWDEETKTVDNELVIPPFKLGKDADLKGNKDISTEPLIQTQNKVQNQSTAAQSLNNKYKIINNSLDLKSNANPDKLSNQKIFISHKKLNKYGLQFL